MTGHTKRTGAGRMLVFERIIAIGIGVKVHTCSTNALNPHIPGMTLRAELTDAVVRPGSHCGVTGRCSINITEGICRIYISRRVGVVVCIIPVLHVGGWSLCSPVAIRN